MSPCDWFLFCKLNIQYKFSSGSEDVITAELV